MKRICRRIRNISTQRCITPTENMWVWYAKLLILGQGKVEQLKSNVWSYVSDLESSIKT